MKNGAVLGKFMPLHKGHLALINFALTQCENLTVLLCHHTGEPISGRRRMQWLQTIFAEQRNVKLLSLEYNPAELTETSNADPVHAKAWAEKVKPLLPDVDVFFSSERYGDAFAAFPGATHRVFDEARKTVPVAASLIRQKPLTYRDYLPRCVRPFFVKKIAVLGSESTGKSTLAGRLAVHYHTCFVPEMARNIIGHTSACTETDLLKIAIAHATETEARLNQADRLLFMDTDLHITKSYSRFLFAKELAVPAWVEEANRSHLSLFLQTDCPYVQDGTRLSEEEREALSGVHKAVLTDAAIAYKTLGGTWDERFAQACRIIDEFTSTL